VAAIVGVDGPSPQNAFIAAGATNAANTEGATTTVNALNTLQNNNKQLTVQDLPASPATL
jgi:hypothetical protein